MFAKALTLASIFATSLALPDVTIKALPAGCVSYPGYNADTNTAGPWTVSVTNSDNPDLEGFGDSTAYSLAVGSRGPVMRWGYLTINYRAGIARRALQCISDKLNVYTDTQVNAAGAPGNVQWTPLSLSPYPYDASLMYLIDGDQPTVYEHYIGGVKQDGAFLGGYNTSTWGVQWQEASPTSYFYPYFYLRLLPEGQALKANETKIFLKIQT